MPFKPESWVALPPAIEPASLSSVIDPSDRLSADEKHARQFDLEENPQVIGNEEKNSEANIGTDDVDPNLVTWDGPDDPLFPKNWPLRTKWITTFLISLLELVTIGSSLMIAPALSVISKDLHITNDAETQLSLSVYVLAFGLGPLFFGPLSELYGRKRIVQISNLWYMVWNMSCGFAKNEALLVVGRLFSGAGASAMFAVGPGMLSDCWTPEQRGVSLSIYTFLPLVGPAVGPIVGGYITERISWRWVFWSSTLFDLLIQLLGIFFFRETHAPTILRHRAAALRTSTGNTALYTEHERQHVTITSKIKMVLTRAIAILWTQHQFQIIAVITAWNFGCMYIVHSTLALLFQTRYHQSVETSGLNYLSMVIGFTIGSQGGALLTDRIYAHIKARQNGVAPRPEHRIILVIPGVLLVPVGLLLYGWSAQYTLHWAVTNLGAVIFAMGLMLTTQCTSSYVVDAAGEYAASTMAGISMARSLSGFGFPLFAPGLFDKLGWGGGNSLLAGLSLLLGVVCPLMLWKWGKGMRERGRLGESWK